MTRRRLVLAVAAASVAAAAVAAWLLVPSDSATPVAVEAVHSGMRSAAGGPGPRPGVYVYATIGFEAIDALGGARHAYPARTALLVRRAGCGFEFDWRPLVERRTVWRLCPSPAGIRQLSFGELHTFFGRADRRTYRCDAASLLAPLDRPAGARFSWRCGTGDTNETASGALVGRETLVVGRSSVTTVHVRVTTRLAGRNRGGGRRDLWLRASDGLPVRMVEANESATASFLGDVRYRERFELRLVSLVPRR